MPAPVALAENSADLWRQIGPVHAQSTLSDRHGCRLTDARMVIRGRLVPFPLAYDKFGGFRGFRGFRGFGGLRGFRGVGPRTGAGMDLV